MGAGSSSAGRDDKGRSADIDVGAAKGDAIRLPVSGVLAGMESKTLLAVDKLEGDRR